MRAILPPLRKMREAAYRRKFVDNVDEYLFMGSYDSFEAAAAAAPTTRPLGFDNAAEARRLYTQQVFFFDYPGLFWLGRALEDGMRSIFDLGGHAGIKFHAFRRMLNYPPDLRWTVCDVPGVVQAGREIAAERGIGRELDFTTRFEDASGYDVLYIAATLQFMPQTLTQILEALPVKPKRVILNTTAVHAERAIFTVHSLGFGFSPYRIQRHEDLLAQLSDAGYKRRDAWRNEGKPFEVPFVEGGDAVYYAGCCFDLY